MSKTKLDPSLVEQLKTLFVESTEGRNLRLKFGRVQLENGKKTITLSADFIPKAIISSKIGSSAGNTYSIDIVKPYQFTIVSSDSSGSEDVFWIAIGG